MSSLTQQDETPVAILKAAREMISDPARWTQEAYGRDAEGFDGGADSGRLIDNAVCFCAAGAVWQTVGHEPLSHGGMRPGDYAWKALDKMAGEMSGTADAVHFNDTHSHADVLALFDGAIARLEAAHPLSSEV